MPNEWDLKNATACEKAQSQLIDRERETLDGDARNVTLLMDAVRHFRDVCVGRNPSEYPELYNAGIADELVHYRVTAISESRCRDDIRDPGCLDSAAIAGYKAQVASKVAELIAPDN